MRPEEFVDRLEDEKIVAAIQAAEEKTSGELRVLITRHAPANPLAEARRQFEQLGMTRTPLRNAVLLFIAPRAQTFAIVGDEGIHLRCGQAFWDDVTAAMTERMKAGDFTGALVAGIQRAGAELARHFPKNPLDRNDLPDSIVRD
jgi:uncharacterized membrane protein